VTRIERAGRAGARPGPAVAVVDGGHPGAAPARQRPGFHGAQAARTCSALGALALLLIAALVFTPLPNRVARLCAEPARLGRAEAIVVLGGSFPAPGELGSSSLHRLVEGVRLYRQGLAPLLVLSGQPSEAGPSEAELRARLARELGVPPAAIRTTTASRSTHEEAIHVAAELRPLGARRILLVTDALHLVRARALFARQGFDVLPAPADEAMLDAREPEARFNLVRRLVRELLARLYYRVRGLT
jgi:uncharacterized SAM-binding protein YcdF (DUF218 family)